MLAVSNVFSFEIVSKAETMKLLPLNYATNNAVFSDLENGANVGDNPTFSVRPAESRAKD